ncbi:hypothetical protein L0156_21395 [bacterium]|nr:hypothetical protein [bacterium]
MTSILVRIYPVQSRFEAALFRPSQSAPYYFSAGITRQDALEKALEYGAAYGLSDEVEVMTDQAVRINPEICRLFYGIRLRVADIDGIAAYCRQQSFRSHERLMQHEELRRLYGTTTKRVFHKVYTDTEEGHREGVVSRQPMARIQDYRNAPLEAQKGEILSKLPQPERDFVQSWDSKPVNDGWICRHVDLGNPIGSSRRSSTAGVTKYADLNSTLSELEAADEMRISMITAKKCSENGREAPKFLMADLNQSELWKTSGANVDTMLQQIKEEFEKLQPTQEPEIFKQILDPEFRKQFVEAHPNLQDAVRHFKKAAKKTRRLKLKKNRQRSRFHFIPDSHDGICVSCEVSLQEVPGEEGLCLQCGADLDPTFHFSHWLEELATLRMLKKLKEALTKSRFGSFEAWMRCARELAVKKLESLGATDNQKAAEAKKLIHKTLARLAKLERVYTENAEKLNEPLIDPAQKKLKTMRMVQMLAARVRNTPYRSFYNWLNNMRELINEMDPGGENQAWQKTIKRLARLEQAFNETFDKSKGPLDARITFWFNVSRQFRRYVPEIQREQELSKNTLNLARFADGTDEGRKKILDAAKDGKPALIGYLLDLDAIQSVKQWASFNRFAFNNDRLHDLAKKFTRTKPVIPNDPNGQELMDQCLRTVLKPLDACDINSRKEHHGKLHQMVHLLTNPLTPVLQHSVVDEREFLTKTTQRISVLRKQLAEVESKCKHTLPEMESRVSRMLPIDAWISQRSPRSKKRALRFAKIRQSVDALFEAHKKIKSIAAQLQFWVNAERLFLADLEEERKAANCTVRSNNETPSPEQIQKVGSSIKQRLTEVTAAQIATYDRIAHWIARHRPSFMVRTTAAKYLSRFHEKYHKLRLAVHQEIGTTFKCADAPWKAVTALNAWSKGKPLSLPPVCRWKTKDGEKQGSTKELFQKLLGNQLEYYERKVNAIRANNLWPALSTFCRKKK